MTKRLFGWRLDHPERQYVPIVPRAGCWASRALDLDLGMDDDRLRFYFGGARLPFTLELVEALERALTDADIRAAAEDERATAEAERATAEAERVAALEAENAALRARLAVLEGRSPGE